MAPAMKCGGQDSFARQSPTVLVATPRAAALQHAALPHVPLFTLVHGEEDTTVPPSSSKKFARALVRPGCINHVALPTVSCGVRVTRHRAACVRHLVFLVSKLPAFQPSWSSSRLPRTSPWCWT